MMQKNISKIYFFNLKKFQLNRCRPEILLDSPPDVYNISILFVSNVQNTNLSFIRSHKSDSFYMDIYVFTRWTMSDIYGILHHSKAIFLQITSEL